MTFFHLQDLATDQFVATVPLGEGGVVLHRTTHRTLYSRGTVVMITALQLLLEPSE